MSEAQTTSPILTVNEQDNVVTLTLNNPAKFNVLSEQMLQEMEQALTDIKHNNEVRCVVIAAAGKAFCAGHDLRQMRTHEDIDYFNTLFERCSRVMKGIVALPVPVIARVQGMATAAGCQLVASCDLAIASEQASFAVSGINVGLFCATPSVALSRNVSPKRAFDMLCTGEFIDAATALDWGLLSDVVLADELDNAVTAKAKTIASKCPEAIRYGKSLFQPQMNLNLDDAYGLAGSVMAQNMMEANTQEGIDAFLEKRTPNWK